ncbi:MAG: hypothetical protein GVY05_01680 [Bacteroidetes bacterium]|jgi:uncharacterized membrane protein YobD (UPF0266 family)|nr:hypothetical protein [Bacteroidota bacterium]
MVSNLKKFLRFNILFLFVVFSYSQEGNINYFKTTDSNNKMAYQLIKNELISPTGIFFKDFIYCGPNIWNRYSKIEKINKIEDGNLIFEIPLDTVIIKKKGKLIQRKRDFKIFWQ